MYDSDGCFFAFTSSENKFLKNVNTKIDIIFGLLPLPHTLCSVVLCWINLYLVLNVDITFKICEIQTLKKVLRTNGRHVRYNTTNKI